MLGKDYTFLLVFCAVTMMVIGLYLISGAGYREYRRQFIANFEIQLKRNFIAIHPIALFAANLAGIILFALLGYVLLGTLGVLVGIAAGFAAPSMLLGVYRQRRTAQFLYQFPDALASLASSLRAGSSVMMALENLTKRQPAPLCQEFSLVLADYRVGKKFDEALDGLLQRIPFKDVELFIASVLISRSVGGHLADTLDALAGSLRQKAQVEGKIKALTGMARLQGWVLLFLPITVGAWLVLMKPEQMRPLVDTWAGLGVLGGVALLMLLAVLTIRKIVGIDV